MGHLRHESKTARERAENNRARLDSLQSTEMWAAASSVDTDIGILRFFERHWTDKAECRMTPVVIEALDVVEDVGPGLLATAVIRPPPSPGLQRTQHNKMARAAPSTRPLSTTATNSVHADH